MNKIVMEKLNNIKPKRGRKPLYTKLLADGHVDPEHQVAWFKKGDGIAYGYKRDEYVRRTLNKKGFSVIKI
ncbi:MAG: hypothetical protein HUJ61_06070 [Bacilli bacterium]|nr:hypothetical protein [Bacilli bacterium]